MNRTKSAVLRVFIFGVPLLMLGPQGLMLLGSALGGKTHFSILDGGPLGPFDVLCIFSRSVQLLCLPFLVAFACTVALRLRAIEYGFAPSDIASDAEPFEHAQSDRVTAQSAATHSRAHQGYSFNWSWPLGVITGGLNVLVVLTVLLAPDVVKEFASDLMVKAECFVLCAQYASFCAVASIPYRFVSQRQRTFLLLNTAIPNFLLSAIGIVWNNLLALEREWQVDHAIFVFAIIASLVSSISLSITALFVRRELGRFVPHNAPALAAEGSQRLDSLQITKSVDEPAPPNLLAVQSDVSTSSPPTRCENCDALIGRLERPFDWNNHLVCAVCHERLAGISE
jgi:hypothetical protein